MIVAVVAARMMQTALVQIIDMIAVGDRFVAAIVVTTSARNRRTVGRVRVVYRDHMLVIMIAV